jgi:recombination protein RecA
VLFGCFSYGTQVTLADGTQEKIGKIVNQRLPVEVLSYDPEVGAVVPKKVVGWFDNGRTDGFLQFTVARPAGNGRSQFACTPNHQIRTPGGWREAGDLTVGDRVMQALPHHLSPFQWEVILGGLMGDGALSPSRSGLGARFRLGHGPRQIAYGDWKASLFANLNVSRSTNAGGAVFHDLQPLPELAELRRAVYLGGKKVFGHDYLKQLTPLSLAIWYMDDGSFSLRAKGLQERTRDGSGRSEICIEAMEPSTRARLVDHLADTWSIRPKLIQRAGKAVLVFSKDETAKLHALIAPFVHPSMQYKLLPRYRGQFEVEPSFTPMRYELVPMPILSIGPKPPSKSTHRFDIEVEGSHNYLADGVVVHNSPETTSGGRALKFYASIRLDVRRIESLKDGPEVVGNRTRAKVVKNKLAPPFRSAEFDVIYGQGISKEGSLLDVGVDVGLIKKSGAWFTYDGDQLGQGRENARNFLRDNPELAREIEEKVKAQLGIGLPPADPIPTPEQPDNGKPKESPKDQDKL